MALRRTPTGTVSPVENRARVELPPYVTKPYEVFVNGVPQVEGADFDVIGTSLLFWAPRWRARAARAVAVGSDLLRRGRHLPQARLGRRVVVVDGRRTVVTLAPVMPRGRQKNP